MKTILIDLERTKNYTNTFCKHTTYVVRTTYPDRCKNLQKLVPKNPQIYSNSLKFCDICLLADHHVNKLNMYGIYQQLPFKLNFC